MSRYSSPARPLDDGLYSDQVDMLSDPIDTHGFYASSYPTISMPASPYSHEPNERVRCLSIAPSGHLGTDRTPGTVMSPGRSSQHTQSEETWSSGNVRSHTQNGGPIRSSPDNENSYDVSTPPSSPPQADVPVTPTRGDPTQSHPLAGLDDEARRLVFQVIDVLQNQEKAKQDLHQQLSFTTSMNKGLGEQVTLLRRDVAAAASRLPDYATDTELCDDMECLFTITMYWASKVVSYGDNSTICCDLTPGALLRKRMPLADQPILQPADRKKYNTYLIAHQAALFLDKIFRKNDFMKGLGIRKENKTPALMLLRGALDLNCDIDHREWKQWIMNTIDHATTAETELIRDLREDFITHSKQEIVEKLHTLGFCGLKAADQCDEDNDFQGDCALDIYEALDDLLNEAFDLMEKLLRHPAGYSFEFASSARDETGTLYSVYHRRDAVHYTLGVDKQHGSDAHTLPYPLIGGYVWPILWKTHDERGDEIKDGALMTKGKVIAITRPLKI